MLEKMDKISVVLPCFHRENSSESELVPRNLHASSTSVELI